MLVNTLQTFKQKLHKYGEFNTYDLLKNIAFFTMVIDHIGYYLLPSLFILRFIGRASAVIFFLLHGFSYKQQNNSILYLGIITSIIIFFLDGKEILPLNILYGIYFSGFAINFLYDLYKTKFTTFIPLIIALAIVSIILNAVFDYAFLSTIMIFAGYLIKNEERQDNHFYTAITLIISLFAFFTMLNFGLNIIYSIILICAMLAIVRFMLHFENKIITIKNKYLNESCLIISRYALIMYPLHLLIILLLHKCL